jgi:hypothetical protein
MMRQWESNSVLPQETDWRPMTYYFNKGTIDERDADVHEVLSWVADAMSESVWK